MLPASLSTAVTILTAPAAAPVDCAGYYYFAEGKRIETITLDERGAVASRKVMTVKAGPVTPQAAEARLTTRMVDARGGAAPVTSEARCENGDLLLDLTSSLPAQKGTLSSARAVLLRYPASVRVGQRLEARIDFDLDGESKGKAMKVNFSLADRHVSDSVSIETSAGRKQAFVIRSVLNVRLRIIGIAIPMRYDLVEYLVPGLGVMRTEAEQKGKVVERSTVRIIN